MISIFKINQLIINLEIKTFLGKKLNFNIKWDPQIIYIKSIDSKLRFKFLSLLEIRDMPKSIKSFEKKNITESLKLWY